SASQAPDYGDSVLYVRSATTDVIGTPKQKTAGTYIGFPEGISIDANTGAINVSKSDAGLRYQVSLIPAGTKDTLSSFITISGINYLDGFYRLSTADSVLHPVYNAQPGRAIPGINNGTQFDIGSGCNSQGCTVIVSKGDINLAQTVRNGVFGNAPQNNDRHEFDLNYAINDPSLESVNTIRVKLYYFNTMSDVTQEAYDIIASRQGTVFFSGVPMLTRAVKPARPRPPCIFIVGH
ncbi:MAG: hypothetical protein JST39_11055, partial [Bacteroidetes bacterium]|nr:hypothetical protein [Bacteroidota bacterium]